MAKRNKRSKEAALNIRDVKRLARERRSQRKEDERLTQILVRKKLTKGAQINTKLLHEIFVNPHQIFNEGAEAHIWQLRQILTNNRKKCENYKHLLLELAKRNSKILEHEYWYPLFYLTQNPIIRQSFSWHPSGKSPERQFRSLVDHYMIQYPVPKSFYSIFHITNDDRRTPLMRLLFAVTSGGSIYKCVQKKLIPIVLNKKACHLFSLSKEENIFHALRRAQLEAMDADSLVIQGVLASDLGRCFMRDEGFWMTVLQWFKNQEDLDHRRIQELVDFILFKKAEDNAFSMKGRTVTRIMDQMHRWHQQLRKKKGLENVQYEPSGYEGAEYDYSKRVRGGCYEMECWSIKEISNSKELALEGSKMHHCVYTYSQRIRRGQCSIWSLRLNGHRQLTIELQNKQRSIVQVRGKYNRSMAVNERRVLVNWMRDNHLRAGKYVLG